VTNLVYYTVDDGSTTYKDLESNDPPFSKDGQEAVRAFVYKCANAKPWVAYLERYTPTAQQMIAEARKSNIAVSKTAEFLGKHNVEVKKPGDAEWVKLSDNPDKVRKILYITCPDGTRDTLEMVY
jgi:hypothetical protein